MYSSFGICETGLLAHCPMGYVCDFKCVNFKCCLGIDILSIQVVIILEWMPYDLVDGKQGSIGSSNGLVPSGNKPLP